MANGADFSAFADNSEGGFALSVPMTTTSSAPVAVASNEVGYTRRSFASGGPSLADNWSRTPGLGSAIPNYSIAGTVSGSTASAALSGNNIAAVIDSSTRYTGDSISAPAASAGSFSSSSAQPQTSQGASSSTNVGTPNSSFAASTSSVSAKAPIQQSGAAQTAGKASGDAQTIFYSQHS